MMGWFWHKHIWKFFSYQYAPSDSPPYIFKCEECGELKASWDKLDQKHEYKL